MTADKTRSIDFATITLRDALDLAALVEQEARERYGELADQMDMHHNPDAAKFFRFMARVEGIHEEKLATRRRSLYGDAPRAVRREMIFDVEAPDYDEARADMSVRQALDAALRSEQKAHAFFEAALQQVKDAEAVVLFVELRDEEVEHQRLVEKQIAMLAPDATIAGDVWGDDPVAQ